MQLWESYHHYGNQEFNDKNYEFALTHFDQALKQACLLLSNHLNQKEEYDCHYLMQIILTSHCNLANCYFELNWIKKACEQFEIAHQFIKSIIMLSTNNQLQIAALKSTKVFKQKWLLSLKKYNKKLPDIQTLRTYSKSMCTTFNLHSFKEINSQRFSHSNINQHTGEKNEIYSNMFYHPAFTD